MDFGRMSNSSAGPSATRAEAVLDGGARLTSYTGRYDALAADQQQGIRELILRRYIQDALDIDAYLVRHLGLRPGEADFERRRSTWVDGLRSWLAESTPRTHVSAIFVRRPDGPWRAVAAMRLVCGSRLTPVDESVGAPESSIPTHQFLRGFRYPAAPGFDPRHFPEVKVCEVCRLAVHEEQALGQLAAEVDVPLSIIQHVVHRALERLICLSYRFTRLHGTAAWIFTTTPALALLLRRKRLPLLPLFEAGASPTEVALSTLAPLAPYFQRWPEELQKAIPGVTEMGQVHEAVRALARLPIAQGRQCSIGLPYLLLDGDALEGAIRALETDLEPIETQFATQARTGT